MLSKRPYMGSPGLRVQRIAIEVQLAQDGQQRYCLQRLCVHLPAG